MNQPIDVAEGAPRGDTETHAGVRLTWWNRMFRAFFSALCWLTARGGIVRFLEGPDPEPDHKRWMEHRRWQARQDRKKYCRHGRWR